MQNLRLFHICVLNGWTVATEVQRQNKNVYIKEDNDEKNGIR